MTFKFDLEDAKRCADRLIKNHWSCGGCKFYAKCGMGDYNANGLQTLMEKIDPSGLNIAKVPLRPIGQGE